MVNELTWTLSWAEILAVSMVSLIDVSPAEADWKFTVPIHLPRVLHNLLTHYNQSGISLCRLASWKVALSLFPHSFDKENMREDAKW